MILSLPETIKEKSTFRAKALRLELVTPDEGASLETSIFPLSFQVVREPLLFAYHVFIVVLHLICRVSQKSKKITLLVLNVCDYTSGNLNELNMNDGSIFIFLRQNYLTKTIAQINDCLFT